MKTKYIKVSVSERLPEKFGHYTTFNKNDQKGYNYFDDELNSFRCDIEIISWLEEVPDREDEMRELLEDLLTHHFDFMGCGEIKELQNKAEKLINELKQTT